MCHETYIWHTLRRYVTMLCQNESCTDLRTFGKLYLLTIDESYYNLILNAKKNRYKQIESKLGFESAFLC
jgi:hypothetical protein